MSKRKPTPKSEEVLRREMRETANAFRRGYLVLVGSSDPQLQGIAIGLHSAARAMGWILAEEGEE